MKYVSIGLRQALTMAFAVVVLGCGTQATAMRTGKVYPSAPAGCPVRFENLDLTEAQAKYEHLGFVMLSGTGDQTQAWEGRTREELWPKVCEIGGTIVTMNGAMNGINQGRVIGAGFGVIQFAVFRERQVAAR